MDILFYSRSCGYCESLFKSGLVSPTTVRLVPVEGAAGRLPPEVHSVPALWLTQTRKVLLGPDVLQHFKQLQINKGMTKSDHPGPGSGNGKGEPSGCFLGDGGVGGAFSPISGPGFNDMGTFGTFEPLDGPGAGAGAGAGAGQGRDPGRPSPENVGALQSRETRDKDSRGALSVNLESFKSRRDAELTDILSRQHPVT